MPDIYYDNYCIIPHSSLPRLLLLDGDAGWTLPGHHTADPAHQINEAMKELFSLDTTVLYCAYDRYKDDEREEQHRVYALENHNPGWTPPANGRWVGRAELDGLDLAIPEHRAVLEIWLTEVESGDIPEQRLPWARFGWFSSAVSWIMEQLASLGYTAAEPVEQVSESIWSTVLRVPTTEGDLYFKASAPVLAFEPALTQTLAQLIPAHLPPVLVVDSERHWMLMKDAGTTLEKIGEYDPNIAHWEEALRLYAQMQIDLAAHTGLLKACGCPDMRLDRLPALFAAALAATPLLLLGQPGGLPEGEYEELRMFTAQLKTMCATLKKYAVPESLHHDDFHGSNIMHNGKTYIFFDWAECSLTHPFCSMVIVERYAKYVLEYDDEKLDRLREAYLVPWTRFEPMERLREAYALAQRLGKLCRALTWRRLVSDVEPGARWEYKTAFPHWLRLFLSTAED